MSVYKYISIVQTVFEWKSLVCTAQNDRRNQKLLLWIHL